jgi:hypothetical protein
VPLQLLVAFGLPPAALERPRKQALSSFLVLSISISS